MDMMPYFKHSDLLNPSNVICSIEDVRLNEFAFCDNVFQKSAFCFPVRKNPCDIL